MSVRGPRSEFDAVQTADLTRCTLLAFAEFGSPLAPVAGGGCRVVDQDNKNEEVAGPESMSPKEDRNAERPAAAVQVARRVISFDRGTSGGPQAAAATAGAAGRPELSVQPQMLQV